MVILGEGRPQSNLVDVLHIISNIDIYPRSIKDSVGNAPIIQRKSMLCCFLLIITVKTFK